MEHMYKLMLTGLIRNNATSVKLKKTVTNFTTYRPNRATLLKIYSICCVVFSTQSEKI